MTNAEARFNNSLRPRKPEGSLGRTAQDVHLDSHTAPELCDIDWLMIAYIALFSALLSRLTALACGSTWVTSFIALFCFCFEYHRSGVLTALAWLVPNETAAVSAQVLCTPYNHAPCHFLQSHIRKVFSCNLPPALLAEWPGSFTCYCGNKGVERIPK